MVVHFWAEWAPQCAQMDEVMKELANDMKNINIVFLRVAAEEVAEVSHRYDISAVPTFILFRSKQKVDRVDGAKAAELVQKVNKNVSMVPVKVFVPTEGATAKTEDLNTRLKKLINSAPIMLFMKGSPNQPQCGFSKQTVALLNEQNVKYSTFDILSDEEVRQGLKTYSKWPAYPQLYVSGELLGGLDILKEMAAAGELAEALNAGKVEDLDTRLKNLINKAPVMLFMKGNQDNPRCGFSKTTVEILKETGIAFDTFDILADEDVRQGLKKLSNWPTYPQLYVKGELLGGLDIIKEMKESGELQGALSVS